MLIKTSTKVSDTGYTNIASVGPAGTDVDQTNNEVSVRRDWRRPERVDHNYNIIQLTKPRKISIIS